ncbi:glutathione S-transferase family protein [Dyella japonica]|uniref:Glutathione S-transferase n=1 Tax=Dyella japonica A8 TaxID=1217721 RepID=A0A075JVP9_9GAMM|nr:glutathione S-transferase family protein [Dyella japonica]AIF46176.1 glutathione S-transferase [Dyella japonica A8]
MPALYIANKNYSSWSLRPWVLMKHLGLPFDEKLMVFGEGSNWEAFRQFSPSGRVPCLRDGDTVVWDSLAIAEYLAESHVGVWPSDRDARAWARCSAAEMHSGFGTLRNECGMNCGIRVRLHAIGPALKADVARINELWNEGLSRFGGPYLAGSTFTAVDAFYAPVVFRIQTYGLPLDGAASAYVQRILALPAMREWYTAALAEPWRDHAHEAETLRYGEVTEDLRLA